MDRTANIRPEVLEGAPLQYAPENELGVVFLFSHYAKKHNIKVERIGVQFPDCIAYQKTAHGEKQIKIEFELQSSNFKTHNHPIKGCDWIVCWEHDWPEVPESIKVIELKDYFGAGFKVWILTVKKGDWDMLNKNTTPWGGLPPRAKKGNLLLIYRTSPGKCIRDVYVLTRELELKEAGWYRGMIKRVCKLDSPIFLEDLLQHKMLKTAPFIRKSLQGSSHDATSYWSYLYEMIIQRNSSIKRELKEYAPDKKE